MFLIRWQCPCQSCSVDVSFSPHILKVTHKVASTTAATAAGGYKNFTNWMSLPQAISTNINNNINTNINNNIGTINNTSMAGTNSLPSFGHLWSHFQQQKQQTAMTTFIQTAPQQPGVQQQQQSVANFQSVQVLQGSPAGLQVSGGFAPLGILTCVKCVSLYCDEWVYFDEFVINCQSSQVQSWCWGVPKSEDIY